MSLEMTLLYVLSDHPISRATCTSVLIKETPILFNKIQLSLFLFPSMARKVAYYLIRVFKHVRAEGTF